jgi:hypothetical protein
MLTAEKEFESALENLRSGGRECFSYDLLRTVEEAMQRIAEKLNIKDDGVIGLFEDLENIAICRAVQDPKYFTAEWKRLSRKRTTHVRKDVLLKLKHLSRGDKKTEAIQIQHNLMDILDELSDLPVDKIMFKLSEECNEICKTVRRE